MQQQKKMFKNDYESNCYSCIMKDMIIVASLLGLCPFTLSCTHNESQSSIVTGSLILKVSSLLIGLLLLLTSSLGLYNFFFDSIHDINKGSDVTLLIHRVITFYTSLFTLSLLYRHKLSINIVKNSISALEYANRIGRYDFVHKTTAKESRRKLFAILMVYSFTSVLICICEILFFNIEDVLFSFAIYIWMMCHHFLYEICYFYELLLRHLYSDMRKTIHYRLKSGILRNTKNERLFSEELWKMLRIRKIIYRSCTQLGKYLSPAAPIIVISQTVTIVLFIYNTIIMIIHQTIFEHTELYWLICFALIILAVCGYSCTYASEQLAESVKY